LRLPQGRETAFKQRHDLISSTSRPSPSPWIKRFYRDISAAGRVLDLACGGGRHVKLLLDSGYFVCALDRDISKVSALPEVAAAPMGRVEIIEADIEVDPWPFEDGPFEDGPFEDGSLEDGPFDGVIVCNYLHRPILPKLTSLLRPGGVLLYETFAQGNEAFGRPKNPDFLLQPGELLCAFPKLHIIAYEHMVEGPPRPAVRQRIFARKIN